MNDLSFDLQSIQAIRNAHDRYLELPMEKEKETCVCRGLGVIPGTETADSYGEVCPKGCDLDWAALRDRGQG